MPKNIQQPGNWINVGPKTIIRASLFIVFVSALVLVFIYHNSLFAQIEQLFVPAWQQTQQTQPITTPTQEIISTETKISTTTKTATITATITATTPPTATPTALPTSSPTVTSEPSVLALNTPIGSDVKLIILRVNEGESLGQFATRFNTTEAAIRAVNFNIPSVLYIDRILIVPINITDVSDLPAFQAVELQEGGITIEALAQELEVAPEDLYLYNNIHPNRILKVGEWLLVPRE